MKPWYIVLLVFLVLSTGGAAFAASDAAAQPQSLGIFGDSLGDGVWAGMYNLAKKHPGYKLFRHAKVGSGLTRGDFANWLVEFSGELDADHTSTAVIIVGVNDQQSIRDENHKGYLFKSDGWKKVYLSRIDSIMGEFEKRKITVIWMGLPVFRDAELNAGGVYMSNLIEAEVKAHGAIFVPLIETFKDGKGEFSSHLPDSTGKLRPVRADDGVHFTPYGYELVGEKAYEAIPNQKSALPSTGGDAAPNPVQNSTSATLPLLPAGDVPAATAP